MSQYELPEQIDQQYNKLLQEFLDGKSVNSSINIIVTKNQPLNAILIDSNAVPLHTHQFILQMT